MKYKQGSALAPFALKDTCSRRSKKTMGPRACQIFLTKDDKFQLPQHSCGILA